MQRKHWSSTEKNTDGMSSRHRYSNVRRGNVALTRNAKATCAEATSQWQLWATFTGLGSIALEGNVGGMYLCFYS